MKTRIFSTLITSIAVVAAVAVGCDSATTPLGSAADGNDATENDDRTGDAPDATARLIVKLTDNPFPFDDAESANVTIVRVELVGDDTTGHVVLADSAQSFNLLELRNGLTAPVADVPLPEGAWRQVRFVVSDDASVVMKDSTIYSLKVPSGPQTGIKVNIDGIDLSTAEDTSIVTVDFDVEDSFVVMGNPATPAGIRGFLFKPVLKIASIEIDGAVQGAIEQTAFSTTLEAVTLER